MSDYQEHPPSDVLVKALRDDTRQLIVMYLMQYEYLSFQNLVEITERSKSTVSHHLKVLKEAGIIEEITIPDKAHKMIKHYSLSLDITEMPAPENVSTVQNQQKVIDLFEYGRFYFRFIGKILENIIEFSDTAYTITKKSLYDNQSVEKPKSSILEQMLGIIKLSKFIAIPLSEEKYSEYMKGIQEYTIDFLRSLKTDKGFENNRDQYWVLAAGVPFDKIRELNLE